MTFASMPRAGRGDRVGGGGRQLADRARAGRRRRPRSRRGTTRCTRSPTRSRRRSRPAARSCSSRARSSPLNAFVLAEVVRGGRPARRRLQPRDRDRPGRGRGDRRAPRDRHGLASPAPRARAGACPSWRPQTVKPVVARARRQVAERDPRRRRPRAGRGRRRGQVLPQLGPDLQRADAHARPARASSSRPSRSRPRSPTRRSRRATRSPTARALGPLVSDDAARARARLHREGRRPRARSS